MDRKITNTGTATSRVEQDIHGQHRNPSAVTIDDLNYTEGEVCMKIGSMGLSKPVTDRIIKLVRNRFRRERELAELRKKESNGFI